MLQIIRSSRLIKGAISAALFAIIPATPYAQTPSSTPVITEGLSQAFRAVVSRLELGGSFFEYSESTSATAIGAFLDELMTLAPEAKSLPHDFSFKNAIAALGLDCITASGSSSRSRADGTFHSRSFSYAPTGRTGLLTLSGGPAERLLTLDFAPKDTDLAIEFPISTKGFVSDALPKILALLPPVEKAKAEAELAESIPGLGVSGRQLLEKLDVRIGIFARLDPSRKITIDANTPPLPMAEAVFVIERAGWIIEKMIPDLMKSFASEDSPVVGSMENGILKLALKQPVSPPLNVRPALRFDPKADRIIVATSVELLDSVVAGTNKITADVSFTEAWRDLPTTGNAGTYVSSRFLQNISDIAVSTAIAEKSPSASDKALVEKLATWVKPHLSHGHAIVFSNQDDGILTSWNTTLASGSSSLSTISAIAMVSGFALPVFASAQQKGREATELNRIRQVHLAVKIYATENDGKYPAALSDLVKRKYINTPEILEFKDLKTGKTSPWIYRSSLTETSPADALLLASPVASPKGTRAAVFNDGSAKFITEEEFQRLSAKRKTK